MASTPESEPPPGAGALHGAEIRHLAALVAVARERSFRAAAKSLGAAQSALSRQVAELERAVGARLVARAPRSVEARLTDAGRLLATHAEAVLSRVEAARADLAAIGGTQPLRVGADAAIATRVMPSVLQRLEGLALEAREAREDAELLEAVERGSVDIAFAAMPLPPGPFAWEEVLEEPYVLLVPTNWSLAQRPERLSGVDLHSIPLVGRSDARGVDHLEARLRSRGGTLRIARRADSDAGVRALVGAGIGAAILPRLSVDPADPATIGIDLGSALGHRTVALAWHRFRRLPAAAARFRGVAGDVCSGLARDWRDIDALERLSPPTGR